MSNDSGVDPTMPALRITDLVLDVGRRPTRRLLDGVNLTVPRGEFHALAGASGSGKTALLLCAGGLDRPSSGSVVVGGHDLRGLSDRKLAALRRDRVGLVFQLSNLIPTLDVENNLLVPAALAGRARSPQRAAALLDRVGVGHRRSAMPHELSGGERQRVAVARALLADPALVLADEPTGALDRAAGDGVLALLRSVVDDGTAVVMVTHDATSAAAADVVHTLVDGRLDPAPHRAPAVECVP